MPVEIKELHIKTIISEGGKDNSKPGEGKVSAKERELIISMCLEKVLETLKESRER